MFFCSSSQSFFYSTRIFFLKSNNITIGRARCRLTEKFFFDLTFVILLGQLQDISGVKWINNWEIRTSHDFGGRFHSFLMSYFMKTRGYYQYFGKTKEKVFSKVVLGLSDFGTLCHKNSVKNAKTPKVQFSNEVKGRSVFVLGPENDKMS